jgi:hypothetical protein
MANYPTLYTSDGRTFVGMDRATVQSLLNDIGSNATFVDTPVIVEVPVKVPVDPNKDKNDWQTQKAKGTDAALSFLASKLNLE